MLRNKLNQMLRQPVKFTLVLVALLMMSVSLIPSVRGGLLDALGSGPHQFLFNGFNDDTSKEDEDGVQGEAKKSGGVKRVVSAPFRAIARLFKGKSENKNDNVAKTQSADKPQNVKIIPVMRTESSVPGAPVDAAAVTREPSTAEAAAQNLFNEAVSLQEKGRTDSSIEKLIAATVIQPNHAEAYNLLGVCYDQKGQYKNAQDEYKKALTLDQNNARYLNNLGYSYYLAGADNDAIKYYGKGLKLTPNDRRMHNNIGLAYGRKKEYDKARRHFLIAVGETGTALNLGYVYNQQGKFDDAIKYYETALKAQPNSLPALSNLSQLYERTGRQQEAATLSEQYKKLAVAAQQKDSSVEQDQ
jgi:Flp pilus assembly protein TadD